MGAASVDARLEHVTLYASGARVRLVTTVPAPVPTRVRIVGLPLSVIADTWVEAIDTSGLGARVPVASFAAATELGACA